ncbi:MAG: DUF2797 domain-containing protein [Thiohalomonadales bacterium]
MHTHLGDTVQYQLPMDDALVDMNALLGQSITLTYAGQINCIHCGRKTKKSYAQGYCFPCMQSLAECDMCIMRPEQCHFAQGTCRDEAWAQDHCMQDHFVYLANSSGIKVGITRHSQIPIRWMDQGASQALPIFRVKNRLISGLIEVALKQWVSDRTDWRKMLRGEAESIDLVLRAAELIAQAKPQIDKVREQYGADGILALEDSMLQIKYPVQHYPEKVNSLNLEKTPEVSGRLQGIKGQYLIMDSGVINMRKYSGYRLCLSSA